MKEKINQRLHELVPSQDSSINEASRYSLLSDAKRLRPLLALATCQTFGVDPLIMLDAACAIEMIHTYSLIHDDLPCMDDDDLRRGKPTLHKVYGEAIALLAGDNLLTLAFEVIANAEKLGREQKLQMIKILSQQAGASGMIGGQAIDIEETGKEIDEEMLIKMHQGKTSALITASLEIGSIGAGYPPSLNLKEIGNELGLAFQFQDDLFDVISTTQALGKPIGSDQKKKKATAVSIMGVEKTLFRIEEYKHSIFSKLQKLPNQALPLKSLIESIFIRKS